MRKLLLGLATTTLFTACMGGTSGPQLDLPPGMAGQWLSNGYGQLLKINEKGSIEVWQYTPDVCLPERDTEDFTDYIDVFELSDDQQSFRAGIRIEQHDYHFDRLADWPSHCKESSSKSPVANFEAFASFMRHHYMMFDLYGVDWDTEVKAARAQVREDMSETALFELMTHMMRDLKDAHLGISGDVDGEPRGFNPDGGNAYVQLIEMAEDKGESWEDYHNQFRKDIWRKNVAVGLLKGQGEMVANNRIQYGLVGEDIGYFGVVTMGGFSDGDDPREEIGILDNAMTNAISLFNEKGVKAVIIDNSINHGGYDFISRQIASHFAAERTKIYSKKPADATQPYASQLYLDPAEGPRFTGPVYLLATDMSVSAGETFTMAMRALPNVTVVGEPTRGALSDVLAKTLPNGWSLDMSNEVYLDYDGEFWEDRGIKPDWALPVFSEGKLAEGHKDALDIIVEKIRSK